MQPVAGAVRRAHGVMLPSHPCASPAGCPPTELGRRERWPMLRTRLVSSYLHLKISYIFSKRDGTEPDQAPDSRRAGWCGNEGADGFSAQLASPQFGLGIAPGHYRYAPKPCSAATSGSLKLLSVSGRKIAILSSKVGSQGGHPYIACRWACIVELRSPWPLRS